MKLSVFCAGSQSLEEVSRSDLGKKLKEGVEEAAKSVKHSAESVSKGGEMLGKTSAFRAISQVCFFSLFLSYSKRPHCSILNHC